MGANTKIEWCDHTFNPWRGCQKVATGCANCYAEAQSKRNTGTLGVWGPNGTRVVAAESAWRQVEKWERNAETTGEAWPDDLPAIFCGSMCDVFEEWHGKPTTPKGHRINVCDGCGKWWEDNEAADSESCDPPCGRFKPRMEWATLADVRQRVFNLIDATPNLTWLLLTKRPQNIRRMTPWSDNGASESSSSFHAWQRRDNVWLGTSIACQEDADRNIPELLKCRDLCAGIFLSTEPLIGPVDLSTWLGTKRVFSRDDMGRMRESQACIDQVIIGGESGPNARLCDVDWIRSIARQCEAAGVPCFVKQLGANVVTRNDMVEDAFNGREGWPDPHVEHDIHGFRENYQGADCRVRLRDKKGGDPAEWPEDLRKYRSLAWKGGA